jgi:cytidylate kinase
MTIIILTGPPASGKNTVAEILSRMRNRCALIDVDLVRHMLRQPHKAPWEGKEGKKQHALAIHSACCLAGNFAEDNADVIILDVLSDETAALYRRELDNVAIILLLPSYDEAYRRFVQRHSSITKQEFATLYRLAEELAVFDKRIDNTALPAEEVARTVNNCF